MEKEQVIQELKALIQNTHDAIQANVNGRKSFEEEYDRIKDIKTKEIDKRIAEIYHYIVHWPEDERRLRKEKEVFMAAVALLYAGR